MARKRGWLGLARTPAGGPSAGPPSAGPPSAGPPSAGPPSAGDQSGGHANPGWSIISYMVAGMAVYGGIGWLIGRWTGYSAVLFPVGLLAGLGLALTLIILRYGRS